MRRRRLPPLVWQVGFARDLDAAPERFVPATVPGAVQLDWARAEGWPPHWQGRESERYAWMEDVYWTYRTFLPHDLANALVPGGGEVVWLVLAGVDYQYEVRIDGQLVHAQEGMFAPAELCLGDVAPGECLEVVVFPVPKFAGAHRPKAQASRSCKPAVSYGWDWHPRLVPLGIWDEAFLELRPAAHLGGVDLTYTLSPALDEARLRFEARLAQPVENGRLVWRLHDPDGTSLGVWEVPSGSDVVAHEVRVPRPRLWWPNGQGEQALYQSTVTLVDRAGKTFDADERRIGFRRVRLVMNEGAWDEPSTFPKSRSTPPITLEINGRRVFGKGTNWVNPDIFPGAITAETYRGLLELAKGAHMNLLRVWGGGIVNKRAFHELCDELGLMVWQEFPLACNDYADDARYLAVLDRESRAIIRRLRAHPSTVLWCGGNELFNVWSGMTDQHKALRILNRNCLDLDPETPFLPTSPVMGMAHGDYRFRDERGREVYRMFAEASATAYTEFGVPGPSDAEVIRSFVPEGELWPPRAGTTWEHHHAFGAWQVAPESWLFPTLIQEYFGPASGLEDLVARGQLMQAEGYKCLFEEARRQWPCASMALNWCYNEPWPAAANNSLVSWPRRPKPSYHAVAASLRPTLASAKLPRFAWGEGDPFEAELWLLHDGPEALPPGTVRATVLIDGRALPAVTWEHAPVPANANLRGPTARWELPAQSGRTFRLRVEVDGHPDRASEYELCFRPDGPRRVTRVGFVNNA